jgi:hypothetical protein
MKVQPGYRIQGYGDMVIRWYDDMVISKVLEVVEAAEVAEVISEKVMKNMDGW